MQLANLGPIIYITARRRRPAVTVSATIAVILGCSFVSMLALSFTWDSVAVIGGARPSRALYLFALTSAAADCTSSVVYWPFTGTFKPQYITALAAGEGTSGLVAALLTAIAVASGAGPSAYFVLLAVSVRTGTVPTVTRV